MITKQQYDELRAGSQILVPGGSVWEVLSNGRQDSGARCVTFRRPDGLRIRTVGYESAQPIPGGKTVSLVRIIELLGVGRLGNRIHELSDYHAKVM